jgi:hypothetical protein
MVQVINTQQGTQKLYDQDILLWVEDTVAKLKLRDFEAIDWDNVIEEIEALGISHKRELVNRLVTLIEHLLKRLYVPLPENYRGWENTIREQQLQLRLLLDDAPSLKGIWHDRFDLAWDLAIQRLQKDYSQVHFPREWQGDRDTNKFLSEDFWNKL